MAIQKSFTHESGVVLASAYHRVLSAHVMHVTDIEGNPEDVVNVEVGIYKDAEARDNEKSVVSNFHFGVRDVYPNSDFTTFFAVSVLNAENVNILKQCYEYMKTQSDLNGIDYTTGVTDV